MNKKIIALAIAALPVAAMADVVLYGKIAVGVETNIPASDDASNGRTNIDDIGSRIGFKGSENLDGGLKAIWQVETRLSVDTKENGSNAYNGANFGGAMRDSFIGLQSEDLGTLQLGYLSNFNNAHQGEVDQWNYGADALGLGLFYNTAARYDNAVRYTSPSFSGVTLFAQYGQAEPMQGTLNAIHGNADVVDQADRALNAGIKFEQGPWLATYGFQDVKVGAVNQLGQASTQDHLLELNYNADYMNGPLYAGFAYKLVDVTTTTVAGEASGQDQAAALSLGYKVGNFVPKISYVQSFGDNNTAETAEYSQLVVGADYLLSKRTTVGGQFGLLDQENVYNDAGAMTSEGSTAKAFGVNVIHRF